MQKDDLLGLPFSRLLVVGPAPNSRRGQARWLCRCDCGTEKVVSASSLKSGTSRSCGCLNEELKRARKTTLRHGHTAANGRSKRQASPTYTSWRAMRDRCSKANHHAWENYGGRGIAVCERWARFENFLADMGERPDGTSLDRIDPNGNYEPGNCRWADDVAQRRNQRLSPGRVREVLARYETEAPDVIARLRYELLG